MVIDVGGIIDMAIGVILDTDTMAIGVILDIDTMDIGAIRDTDTDIGGTDVGGTEEPKPCGGGEHPWAHA
jgi:hypothetical protein